jgi:hypothetical protein
MHERSSPHQSNDADLKMWQNTLQTSIRGASKYDPHSRDTNAYATGGVGAVKRFCRK